MATSILRDRNVHVKERVYNKCIFNLMSVLLSMTTTSKHIDYDNIYDGPILFTKKNIRY